MEIFRLQYDPDQPQILQIAKPMGAEIAPAYNGGGAYSGGGGGYGSGGGGYEGAAMAPMAMNGMGAMGYGMAAPYGMSGARPTSVTLRAPCELHFNDDLG